MEGSGKIARRAFLNEGATLGKPLKREAAGLVLDLRKSLWGWHLIRGRLDERRLAGGSCFLSCGKEFGF